MLLSPVTPTKRTVFITRFYYGSATRFGVPHTIITEMTYRRITVNMCRLRLKCGGTRAETRFRLSAKRTSPFKWAGASVQSTTGSRGVRISGSNAG